VTRGRRGICQVVGQYDNQRFAAPGPGGLVFIGPKGGRLRRSNFRKFWHRTREAVGLYPSCTFMTCGIPATRWPLLKVRASVS
jgi:hypothetical protein